MVLLELAQLDPAARWEALPDRERLQEHRQDVVEGDHAERGKRRLHEAGEPRPAGVRGSATSQPSAGGGSSARRREREVDARLLEEVGKARGDALDRVPAEELREGGDRDGPHREEAEERDDDEDLAHKDGRRREVEVEPVDVARLGCCRKRT